MSKKAAYFSIFFLITLWGCEHLVINASEAAQHKGKYATVIGTVANTGHINRGKRNEMLFLNLNRPHPHQDFTIVIRGQHKNRFRPLRDYKGKKVRVTGRIGIYRGKPQIRVKAANKLKTVN